MSDKEFLNETKRALVGERQGSKVVKKLARLGYVIDGKGQNGHWHLYHKRLGNYKLTISSSLSDSRGALAKITEIRHVMWKVAA